MSWSWPYALEILPALLGALVVTIQATISGTALALVVGLFLALGRLSRATWIRVPAASFVEFIRSTPLLIQLYFLFFVLPQFGLTLDPFVCGVIGLGLHYSTYMSEVYRAGIESVPSGQSEAAAALNLSARHTWTLVILPQAIPPVVPILGNYLVAMFKDSSLLSTITVVELLGRAQIIGSNSFRYLEPLTLVGVLYFAVSFAASLAIRASERKLSLQPER